MFLSGKNIYLRPLEVEDAEFHLPWINDSEVIQTANMHLPYNLEKQKKWIESRVNDKFTILLGIVKKSGDILIGNTTFIDIDPISAKATFGLLIGDKKEWNNGFGTEATKLMIAYGFNTLNLNRIQLTVHATNIPAIRIYEKIGFVKEGCLRSFAFKNGKYIDAFYMGILASDFKNLT